MDTWGDVIGVVVVLAMIRVGWALAKAAWNELPDVQRGGVLDLRAETPRRS